MYKTCNSCRDIGRKQFKQHRENTTEKELERNRQYRIDNVDKVREYDRQRDAIRKKEIIQCECGASICYGYKAEHRQTKKHQELMANNNL